MHEHGDPVQNIREDVFFSHLPYSRQTSGAKKNNTARRSRIAGWNLDNLSNCDRLVDSPAHGLEDNFIGAFILQQNKKKSGPRLSQ